MRTRHGYIRAFGLLVLSLAAGVAIWNGRPLAEPPLEETARIAAHLERVEHELRHRDVSHLTPEQRAARAENLRRLHEYRLRGVFPHNHDFPGERVPYFIDRHGTRCAMAYLIEQSGHGEFVQRIAATRNNARVRELAGESELVAWLDANGLTAAEAARIQPEYCWAHPEDPACQEGNDRSELSDGEAALGYSAALLGVAAIVLSSASDDGAAGLWRPALAVGSGALGLAFGIPRIGDAGPGRTMGILDAGVGAAALAVGAYRLVRGSPVMSQRAAEDGSTIEPLVARGPLGDARIGLRMRF